MVGKCFYYDTPGGAHLFIVLAPIPACEDSFLCVNISTKHPDSDATCELLAGEYVKLTKPVSYVVYRRARDLPVALINRLCAAQGLPDMPSQLLLRIQKAPLTPYSQLPKKWVNVIREYLGE